VGETIVETTQKSAPEAGTSKPLLAFIHIPRTGGGTVSSAISRNYSRLKTPGNMQKGPAKTRSGLQTIASRAGNWQAVGDHVPLGLCRQYLPEDTRYITILREPVDRVLSHYHFHAQEGNPPGSRGHVRLRKVWEQILTNERAELGEPEAVVTLEEDAEFSLEEGLRRKLCIYDNFMTRFLWGGDSIYGELPHDALDRAKENVADLWFAGMRERLDESIILLGRKLGIGLMPYNLRHVSKKRPALEETSPELRELVAEHNALDLELYRFARELFDESAPPPAELTDEVEELRRRSAEVTETAIAERGAKAAANRATGRKQGRHARRAREAAQAERAKESKAERRGKTPKSERKTGRTEKNAGEPVTDTPSEEQ
jgi:hypothetical protein